MVELPTQMIDKQLSDDIINNVMEDLHWQVTDNQISDNIKSETSKAVASTSHNLTQFKRQ